MRGLKIPYESNHKIINKNEYKKCSMCDNWFPMNEENFYKNKSSKSDGFSPYCKECMKNKQVKYQRKHKNEQSKRFKIWYQQNREDKIKTSEEWNEENSERKLNNYRIWQRNNKDKIKKYNIYRGMHKKHEITNDEWKLCKEYFNNECAYCGIHISEHFITYAGKLKWTDFHKEHVDHDGSNDLSNCVPSCKSCNGSKHNKDLEEWYCEENEIYDKDKLIKIYKWITGDFLEYKE